MENNTLVKLIWFFVLWFGYVWVWVFGFSLVSAAESKLFVNGENSEKIENMQDKREKVTILFYFPRNKWGKKTIENNWDGKYLHIHIYFNTKQQLKVEDELIEVFQFFRKIQTKFLHYVLSVFSAY